MSPTDIAACTGGNNSFGGDGHTTYGHMDRSEEKMYLEKMLSEARSEAEREVFRRKLDELNRQM